MGAPTATGPLPPIAAAAELAVAPPGLAGRQEVGGVAGVLPLFAFFFGLTEFRAPTGGCAWR